MWVDRSNQDFSGVAISIAAGVAETEDAFFPSFCFFNHIHFL